MISNSIPWLSQAMRDRDGILLVPIRHDQHLHAGMHASWHHDTHPLLLLLLLLLLRMLLLRTIRGPLHGQSGSLLLSLLLSFCVCLSPRLVLFALGFAAPSLSSLLASRSDTIDSMIHAHIADAQSLRRLMPDVAEVRMCRV
jgi:hypothetical protein